MLWSNTTSRNCSWMLSNTSLSTSKVSTIFLCESCSATRARFDAISPQLVHSLPRCGVPRKTINLVRRRHASDLRMAYERKSTLSIIGFKTTPLAYVFNNNTAKAVGQDYDRVLICYSISPGSFNPSKQVGSPHSQHRAQVGLQGYDHVPTRCSCYLPGIALQSHRRYIRTYSCLTYVRGKVVLRPEHLLLSQVSIVLYAIAFGRGRWEFEVRLDFLSQTRRADCTLVACFSTARPRLVWMSSQAVYEDNTAGESIKVLLISTTSHTLLSYFTANDLQDPRCQPAQ